MQMLAPGQGSAAVLSERLDQLLAKPWLPHVINVLALVLLTASLAQWTWLLITPRAPVTAAGLAPVPVEADAPTFDLAALQAAQIFGAAPVVAPSSVEDIPLSSLNLVLTGLIAAGDNSIALIRVEGQAEAPFALGEEINAGAVLRAVYADRAIIERGGVVESLLLEGAAQPLPGTPTAPAPKPKSKPAPRARAAAPPINANDIRAQGENNYVVSREALTAQMRNPQKMLSQSLMVPQPGGGFLVREIQPGSVYERLGLRVGDVVRSANSQPLNSMEDVMKLYQQSSNNNYIHLEVLRNGRVENLQYTLQ